MANARRMAPKTPKHVKVESLMIGDVPCEWLGPKSDRALMYLHGGGYVFGGLDSHRDLGWRLAEASGMRVLMVDYRLAPENPFPAAIEDASECYRWLIEQGYAAEQLAIGGDSAGGGLTLATLLNIKNLGMPMPHSAILLSPWCDLSMSGDSISLNAESDSMLAVGGLKKCAEAYLGDRDRRAPFASPLFGDLSGLPPMLIQVGSTEILLSDSRRLADKLKAAGSEAALEVWPNMPHVFQVFAARVPEGKQAIRNLGEFLRGRASASAAGEAKSEE
ncbi:MAG: alpha/beta hydrolase [Gammaproteobacteria bacterium]|nr:alpha/beta hydrolase [Gammaproteobacteria bacterium]